MPTSTLTVISKSFAFNDVGITSNPDQNPINWARTFANIPVDNAGTRMVQVDPYDTNTVINGVRATSIDNTTAFNLTVSALGGDRYRLTHSGGVAPAFRTNRGVNASTIALTLVVNPNLSVTVTAGSGTPFASVVAGDVVFIPGLSTGDSASPFNSLNEGYWSVLSSTSTVLVMVRPADVTVFSGVGEVVTPSTALQFQAFSTAGVQVGDTVDISAGLAITAQHAYEIVAVNPEWVEFLSTAALAPQAGAVPTTAGIVFYKVAVRYLRVEADQECTVQINGDTGNTNRLEPLIPGDEKHVAWRDQLGPVWQLVIVNRTSAVLNVTVLQAE